MEINTDRLKAVLEDPETTRDNFDEAVRRLAVIDET